MTARRLPATTAVRQELEAQWTTLLQHQDALREEIKRGTECLRRAERDLSESRSRLENWTTYEANCGVDCLGHLTELVSTSEHVTRFLNGWIERRSVELTGIEKALRTLAHQHGSEASPNVSAISVGGLAKPPGGLAAHPAPDATKTRPVRHVEGRFAARRAAAA